MFKRLSLAVLLVFLLSSHDMYLKLGSFYLQPQSDVVIQLFNGTFDLSENVITRDRMLDVSLVGNGQRTAAPTENWFEKDSITFLRFTTGEAGTWVAGVSTRARNIEMTGEAFNQYLEHDGVLDMLELRKQKGILEEPAIERYSKHVKTIFQVGEQLSEDFGVELGYPIEFIPKANPYDLHPGHKLPVQLLFKQKPLANQLVYLGHKPANEHTHDGVTHSHADGGDHEHSELLQLRTDENGMIQAPISAEGVWYLRTIHLAEVDEEGLTHESNWATLTFAIGEGHSHEDDHHHDEHEHENGIPSYVYLGLSLVIILGLYFWFQRKKKSE